MLRTNVYSKISKNAGPRNWGGNMKQLRNQLKVIFLFVNTKIKFDNGNICLRTKLANENFGFTINTQDMSPFLAH